MSEDTKVKGLTADNATLLLAAAEKLKMDRHVVRVSPVEGSFIVPAEVAKEAGLDKEKTQSQPTRTARTAQAQAEEESTEGTTEEETKAEEESTEAKDSAKSTAKSSTKSNSKKEDN